MSRSALIDADELLAAARAQFDQAEDERNLSIGTWSDEHLLLPRGSGMVAHQSDLTPYWRRIHEVARARVLRQPLPHDPQAHLVEEITVICSAQIGKTYGLVVPTLAWISAVAPRDVGVILPSHDDTKQFARNKLRKSFEESPRLAGLFPRGAEALARKVGAKAWLLDQLTLYFLNGAVAQQLRQRDIPILLEDEFDALPANVDGQGSPLLLAQERQKSFPAERFTLRITTPTTIDAHGWRLLNQGDHQRLLIACETCGHHQWLDPERIEVTIPDASPEAIQIDDLAVWRCAKCGHRHRTDDIRRAIARACASPLFGPGGGWMPGTWEQQRDGSSIWTPDCSFDLAGRAVHWANPSGLHRSHWLNSLYSSFITLGRYVRADRDSSSGSSDDRQTFINNWQANPFSPRTDGLSADTIATSIVRGVPGYQHGQCPTPAWKLLLSCDQQGISIENSWFPYVLRAWMDTGESFLVEAGRVDGFDGLDLLAQKTWPVGGIARKADLITLDTGNGTMMRPIRSWCAQEKTRRISIAGSGTMGPEYSFNEMRASPKNADRMCGCAVAYYYNANLFRDLLALRIGNHPSVMPWHIPPDTPEFYRDSLTAEERIYQETTIKGRPVRRSIWRPKQWTDDRGTVHERKDNHWFDCFSPDTEVLSHDGWRKFTDLRGDEHLATMDLATQRLAWQQPSRLIYKHHSGEMVQIGGPDHRVDLLVTPTHRMVTGNVGLRWKITTAADLVPSHRLPTAPRPADGGVHNPDLWALMGWLASEGSTCGRQARLYQSKPDHIGAICALLSRRPERWIRHDRFWATSDRWIRDLMRSMGTQDIRRLPRWIMDGDQASLQAFIDAAIDGDGWREGKRLSLATISPGLADDYQEVWMLLGHGSRISTVAAKPWNIAGRSGMAREQYHVHRNTAKAIHLRTADGAPIFHRTSYAGMVVCATVPNGTLIVRRNGKPVVAGNCESQGLATTIILGWWKPKRTGPILPATIRR